ncbi:MAG: nucleotide exchange factor GrpE [Fimbriiglobus sp.]
MPDDFTDPIPADLPPAPPGDAALQARVDQLEKQASDYKLLIADFENSRKRLVADAERHRKYASEGLVRDLLTGLDNLDRAVQAAKQAGDAGPLAQGVSATVALLLDVLKRHGVTRIEVGPGTAFDPNRHEAVMQQPSADHPPGAVTAVLQQGFVLHDRVIRPASVAVATEA